MVLTPEAQAQIPVLLRSQTTEPAGQNDGSRSGPGGNTERFLVTRQVGVGLHVRPQGRASLQTNVRERGR